MRCAAASLERDEPQIGTASTISSFLLVECAGPWGVNALSDSRLPVEVKAYLRGLRGMRPLLIRRHATTTARVFLARRGTVATVELDDIRALPSLDLDRDLSTYDERLFLVCTHGRHDACCAERGRPLWQAVQRFAPDQTWQVSHIGGDRFAANMLVLPEGLYYGRLTPDDAEHVVATHEAGHLDLDHLRGRCAYSFAAQAAEVLLRRALGETGSDALRLVAEAGGVVDFEVGGRRWRVEVIRTQTRAQLTCRADTPGSGWTFRLGSLTEQAT